MKPRDNPGLVSVWDKAKNDYLEGNYESLHGLAKKWEVNYNTLCDRVYKGIKIDKAWRDEKKAIEEEVKTHAVEVAKKKLATTYSKTSGMMDDLLDRIKIGIESGVFSIKEFPDLYAKLGTALKNVHSTLRLETGKSTQNIEVKKNKENLEDALTNLKNKGLIDLDTLENIEIIED